MEWFEIIGNVFWGFLALIATGGLLYLSQRVADYVQKKYDAQDIYDFEQAAMVAVRAAEQTFKTVYDVADDFIDPEMREKIDAEIEAYNKSKKDYAVRFMASQFPQLDEVQLDAYIEAAVNYYKSFRQNVVQRTDLAE